MDKSKLEDWEYMLKSIIYKTLNNYYTADGLSFPCKMRTEIENIILSEFKAKLLADKYIITKSTTNG